MTETDKYRNFKCGIASFVANYIAGILHPFDVIKTRFQSHDGKGAQQNLVPRYRGIYHAFRQILAQQGLQGIFKGFYISLFSQAFASSLFFWLYEKEKQRYIKSDWSVLTAVSLASLQGGIFASIISQPFWVIKTRMLLNTTPHTSQIKNFYEKTLEIYKQYGFKGYSKGLLVNLWLSVLGITQMFFYEGARIMYDIFKIPETPLAEKNFICGGLSKVLSGLFLYPLTTVRTRIQQNQFIHSNNEQKYKGIVQIISRTMKEEGIRGFYKGLAPNILKGIPQRGIYFYCYQLIKEKVFSIDNNKQTQ